MVNQDIVKNQSAVVKATGGESIVDNTLMRITELVKSKGLTLPADYSAGNAVRGAFLLLLEIKDTNKNPVLKSCTKESISFALLSMVVQGLNATKQQCYFIAYGKKLICQRSYFGNMALAKRVDTKIDKIIAMVIYEGDDFVVGIENGEYTIKKHEQTIASMISRKVVAAYATAIDHDGNVRYCDVLSMEQIKSAWKMSKMNPIDNKGNVNPSSNHSKHIEEMSKKTVISHMCKIIINSSGDAHLVDAMKDSDQIVAQESAEATALIEANSEVIDITPEAEPEVVTDPDTGEVVPDGAGIKSEGLEKPSF